MFKKPAITVVIVILLFFSPASLAGDLTQGLEYYNTGDYRKAETFFRRIVITEPNNYSAKYMLAASLVNRQKYNEAKELYRNVVINSGNEKLVSLSRAGLRNLGESPVFDRSATRAVINVSKAGTVMIVDNVILNDSFRTKFVLDTGATYTTISKAAASQLGISTKGAQQLRIMTGSGYITAPLVKVAKMELKGLVAKDVEVVITDLPTHLAGDDDGIVGLLGLSFLDNFKITVDRAGGQITLEKN